MNGVKLFLLSHALTRSLTQAHIESQRRNSIAKIKTTSTDLHTWAHHRKCVTTTDIRIKFNMVRVRTRSTYLQCNCTIVFYKGMTVELVKYKHGQTDGNMVMG